VTATWPGLGQSGPIGLDREGPWHFCRGPFIFSAMADHLGSRIGGGIGSRQQQGAGLVNRALQGGILLLPMIGKRCQHKIIVWIISEVHEPALGPFAGICKQCLHTVKCRIHEITAAAGPQPAAGVLCLNDIHQFSKHSTQMQVMSNYGQSAKAPRFAIE
jgi:hypothetical protein